MKKLLIILVALCTGWSAFADSIIQADLSGNGYLLAHSNYTVENKGPYNNGDYAPFAGFSGAYLWEFNSDNESQLHFFAGAETGVISIFVPFSAVGGLSYNFMKNDKISLDLNTSIQLGAAIPLMDVTPTAFGKLNVDVIVMNSSRKGIYGGIGITDSNIPYLNNNENHELDLFFVNYAGMRLVAGYKF